MKYCIQCGRELTSEAKFCTFCGAAQPQPADRPSDVAACEAPAACETVINTPEGEFSGQQAAEPAAAPISEQIGTEATAQPVAYYTPQSAAQPAHRPSRRERDPRRNGLGVAGFVLSLVGITFCWVPEPGPALVLSGVSLGLSVAGLALGLAKKRSWSMAMTGLIISLIALIINLIVLYFA